MTYRLEIKLAGAETGNTTLSGHDEVMLELAAVTPDGHRLEQSVTLIADDANDEAFISVGLESEEEARQRGQITGLLDTMNWAEGKAGGG